MRREVHRGDLGIGDLAAHRIPPTIEVTAAVGNVRATSRIAVYEDGLTHIWFGGTIGADRDYEVASNWLGVADRRESTPTATDVAFVPLWETNGGPQLHLDAQLGGLSVQRYGAVDLNGFTLTSAGTVSAALASVGNGVVIAGGNGTRVSGQFDRLHVGRVDFCSSDAATLDAVTAKELAIVCTAAVFTGAGSWTLPDGELHLSGDLEVSGQTAAFAPSGAHLTRFTGAKAQNVIIAPGAGSFARASVENRSDTVFFRGQIPFTLADGVALDLAPGTMVEMWTGRFDVASIVNVTRVLVPSTHGPERDSLQLPPSSRTPGGMRNSQVLIMPDDAL